MMSSGKIIFDKIFSCAIFHQQTGVNMFEKISIGQLPKGTTAKIKKRAKELYMLKKNGEPHVSEYVRKLIDADLVKK